MLVFLGSIAKIYPNLSDGAKKYQMSFLVPLLGMDSISKLGSDAKKCQQAFLVPLPGMDSTSKLGSDAKKCQQSSPPDGTPGQRRWTHHHRWMVRRTGVDGYIISVVSYARPASKVTS